MNQLSTTTNPTKTTTKFISQQPTSAKTQTPSRSGGEPRAQATESTSLAVNHHHAGKPKPPRFVLQQKTQRGRESTEGKKEMRKREKNSDEMRGERKFQMKLEERSVVPRREIDFLIKYKVYSSFSFVKSYYTLCKTIWRWRVDLHDCWSSFFQFILYL